MQRIAVPVNIFCASYFSYGKCSQTISRGNGLTPITILEAKQYSKDKRLYHKMQQFSIVQKKRA
jgi:hypothetical protein